MYSPCPFYAANGNMLVARFYANGPSYVRRYDWQTTDGYSVSSYTPINIGENNTPVTTQWIANLNLETYVPSKGGSKEGFYFSTEGRLVYWEYNSGLSTWN